MSPIEQHELREVESRLAEALRDGFRDVGARFDSLDARTRHSERTLAEHGIQIAALLAALPGLRAVATGENRTLTVWDFTLVMGACAGTVGLAKFLGLI